MIVKVKFFYAHHCVRSKQWERHQGNSRVKEATRNSLLLTPGDESPGQAAAKSRTPPWEEPRRSWSRSDHRRKGPTDPKQGGPFKVTPFDPKEMRSDAWVHNFEWAIRSYFKGAHVSEHLKQELFFDSLSNQQRNAIS